MKTDFHLDIKNEFRNTAYILNFSLDSPFIHLWFLLLDSKFPFQSNNLRCVATTDIDKCICFLCERNVQNCVVIWILAFVWVLWEEKAWNKLHESRFSSCMCFCLFFFCQIYGCIACTIMQPVLSLKICLSLSSTHCEKNYSDKIYLKNFYLIKFIKAIYQFSNMIFIFQ